MAYLEFLRARRVFVWYALGVAVVVAMILLGAFVGNNAHVDVSNSSAGSSATTHVSLGSMGVVAIPIEGIVGTACILALAFATALAASFNRETSKAHFTFVRPISRVRMGVLLAATDLVAIAVAALYATIFGFIATAGSLREHAHFTWSSDTIGVAILGMGSAFMWYALLQAASAWTTGRGGAYVGVTAALFGLSIPLSRAEFLGPIVYVFRAILYIDPLAYFTSVTISGDSVTIGSQILSSVVVRSACVWTIALLALALAIYCWKRVEV